MLLLQKEEDGKRRRCDGRCYRGPGKRCTCICKGKCHGVGLQVAIEYIVQNRGELEANGIEVMVEDRLLFDIDPVKEAQKKRATAPELPVNIKAGTCRRVTPTTVAIIMIVLLVIIWSLGG